MSCMELNKTIIQISQGWEIRLIYCIVQENKEKH